MTIRATSRVANIATGLAWQPMSELIASMTHGNGLQTNAGYDLDQRLTQLQVKDGASVVQGWAYAYSDSLNLTGITDQVAAANSNTLSYSPANRLASASGAWGSNSFSYDSVGNRMNDLVTGSVNQSRVASYAATSNRITGMTENGAAFRSYSYDNGGNIITDVRPGAETFAYFYNNRNRMASVTRNGVAFATYIYYALEQLVSRNTSASGGPVGSVHYIYDVRTPRKSCRLLRRGPAHLLKARMAQGPRARGNRMTQGCEGSLIMGTYLPDLPFLNGIASPYVNTAGGSGVDG